MHRRQCGFTLMEALISLLLVLLGLTGAARLQASLLAASAAAKAGDEAAAFALEQLSALRVMSRTAADRDLIVPDSRQHQGLLHRYRIEWDVEDHPEPDIKRVDVRVLWPAENPSQRIEIQTLLPGLDPTRFARQQLRLPIAP